jgi:hypothetical protein
MRPHSSTSRREADNKLEDATGGMGTGRSLYCSPKYDARDALTAVRKRSADPTPVVMSTRS